MRLLWLIDSLTLGGAEALVTTFAHAARGSGFDLTVCALKTIGGNPIERQLRDANVDVVNLGARNLRDLPAFRRLLRVVRERNIELIHSHLTYASIWGSIASRQTAVPHVATLHTLPVKRGRTRDAARQRLMSMLLSRHARRVIAVSAAQAEEWIASGLLQRDQLEVVPNAVESDWESIPSDQRIDARSIIAVAVLREGKGIDVLLRAFAGVIAQMPSARLSVAGEGPLRGALEAEAQRLELGSHVEWLGYRGDLRTLLPRFSLFVHPSLQDALPTAVLEAMAAGLPVVASRVGGIPEIVRDEIDGLLVPPADEAALTQAITHLLEDRALAARLAASGKRRVADQFSPTVWLARLREIYERAVVSR